MTANGKNIVVIGGGIAGISAAIEASEAGAEVTLVEKAPYLGGRVARLNQYFPKLCPPLCGLEINFRRLRTSPRIRCLTSTEVKKISGGKGDYEVTVERRPRLVTERCTACGACVEACPVERPNEFNYGTGKTKAIYLPFETAHPLRFTIDESVCKGNECGKCVEACPYGAIDLNAKSETTVLKAGAIIAATGWEPYDATRLDNLGGGQIPNVITNVAMERLAAVNGPTGGKIVRPSDGKEIESIAFIQCAGSRDENHLKYCSGVCCAASLKQTRYVREQYPEAQIYVFYIDVRTPGRLEDFYAERQKDEKLSLVKGKAAKIEAAADGDVTVEAEDVMGGRRLRQQVNLAVLATGVVPTPPEVGVELEKDEHGFLTAAQPSGVIPVGCVKRPSEVSACVRDAAAGALKALQLPTR